MLIAVPVLLLAQPLMESRFRMILQHIRDAHLLKGADLARMDEILVNMIRWRDSGATMKIVWKTAQQLSAAIVEVIS